MATLVYVPTLSRKILTDHVTLKWLAPFFVGMTGFDRWIRFLPYACRVCISARTHRYTLTSANLVTRVKTAIASAFATPQLAAVVA